MSLFRLSSLIRLLATKFAGLVLEPTRRVLLATFPLSTLYSEITAALTPVEQATTLTKLISNVPNATMPVQNVLGQEAINARPVPLTTSIRMEIASNSVPKVSFRIPN